MFNTYINHLQMAFSIAFFLSGGYEHDRYSELAYVQTTLPLSVALWRLQPFVLRNLQEALLRSFWATEWWPRFTNDWVLMHFVSNTRLDWLKKTLHGQPRIPDPRLAAPMCSRNAGCCCWVQRELANVGHQFGTPSMIFDGCTDLVAKYSYGYHFASPWVICWIQQNLCRISTVYSALFGTSPWWQAQVETTDRLFTARIALDPVWAMLF